jgi:hypothetical protein
LAVRWPFAREADVADAVETIRHGVQQEPANELVGNERHHLGLAVMAIVFPGEADLAVGELGKTRVFQEPMSSRHPLLTVGEQIAEVARLHQGLGRAAARRHAIETLARVNIPDPDRAPANTRTGYREACGSG